MFDWMAGIMQNESLKWTFSGIGVFFLGGLIWCFKKIFERAHRSPPEKNVLEGEDTSICSKNDDRGVYIEGGVASVEGSGKACTIDYSKIDVMGDNTIYIKNNVREFEKKDFTKVRQTYLKHLVATLKYLPLRGMDIQASDPSGNKEKLELDRVYITLDTTTSVKIEKNEKKEEWPFSNTRPLSALKAAVDNRSLVLLGDPGSGKTTFINHLTLCLALQSLSPDTCDRLSCWPGEEVDILPIYVVLRDFAGSIPKDEEEAQVNHLWNFIETRLKSQRLDKALELLEGALEEGRAVVLLDGLDEIPTDDKRKFVRDAVSVFSQRYDKNRFIITCRVRPYEESKWQLDKETFPVFELAPFDDDKIDAFIAAWYGDLERLHVFKNSEESKRLTLLLQTAVRRRDLWRLAPNPLLLTIMALVHTHKGELPDYRALLYEETVDVLLLRWNQIKKSSGKTLQDLLREGELADVEFKRMLWKIAFEAHGRSDFSKNDGVVDIEEAHLKDSLAKLNPEGDFKWADEVIKTIKMRAGLLLERNTGIYSFPHRTFQEYLAAAYLASRSDFRKKASTLAGSGDIWREVILLAVGHLVYVSGDTDRPMALVGELCPPEVEDCDMAWQKVWLAGEVLVEIGISRVKRHGVCPHFLDTVKNSLVLLIQKGRLSPKQRVAAGNALGRIGDPRFDEDNYFLPADEALGFVTVSAGSFLMGSDEKVDSQASANEQPQHPVELETYKIARYPVTVAQYKMFAKESGVSMDDVNSIDNHPVVRVNWHDAVQYCEWLTKKMREKGKAFCVTLPTEAQWEKVSRGGDARIYPWGENITPDRANYSDTGIGSTSPVGCFPDGATMEGVMDLAGNVYEWCLDYYDERYYSKSPSVNPTGPDTGSNRVLRGGSWIVNAGGCRSADRSHDAPGDGDYFGGFRLVLSPGQKPVQGKKGGSSDEKPASLRTGK